MSNTPVPWAAKQMAPKNCPWLWTIYSTVGERIVIGEFCAPNGAENAALAVRAINRHEELLTQCDAARALLVALEHDLERIANETVLKATRERRRKLALAIQKASE